MPDATASSDWLILDWALVVAALLALVHLAAPLYRERLRKHSKAVGSLGGGMAVTYVFLQLFPELRGDETILGRRIHLIVLLGFLAYYGIEHSFGLREI
jgi:hypothetical protein